MRKFHQIFWVALPACIYSLFWIFWSLVLIRPVPVVGKFIWVSGLSLKKLLPNLSNPKDQFIYFPEVSRWWDIALAPIGALVLVLLYYNKKFNEDLLSYEDINFGWGKLLRDITNPFLRPYYVWKERQHENKITFSMNRAEQIEEEHVRRSYPPMEGIKTMMVYPLIICLFFGTFFGILIGPLKGPFGMFGVQPFLGCIIGPLMLLSRRWQIAVMTHVACWVGLSYGFSIGIGMMPALIWTSYMFIPTGLFILFVCCKKKTRSIIL